MARLPPLLPLLKGSPGHGGAGHAWSHAELRPRCSLLSPKGALPGRAVSRDRGTDREVEAAW